MISQQQAARFLASHGHAVHLDGPDRVIAECIVCQDGAPLAYVEFGAFHAPFSAREMRDWLGY